MSQELYMQYNKKLFLVFNFFQLYIFFVVFSRHKESSNTEIYVLKCWIFVHVQNIECRRSGLICSTIFIV